VRLTVLGSAASYAGAGEACSGHLVESAGARVLIDVGNGVLANLVRVLDPLHLDAVFVTHAHPDHFLDVYALQSLLRYAPQGPAPALPLYLPSGLFDRILRLHVTHGADDMRAAFRVHDLVVDEPLSVGDLKITPKRSAHLPDSFGLVIESGGVRLAYTSDTCRGAEAEAIAADADTLLAEATLPEAYAGKAPHMTAREAGELAASAGASRLILTHIWPTNDRAQMAREAKAAFNGEVLLAEEMLAVEL